MASPQHRLWRLESFRVGTVAALRWLLILKKWRQYQVYIDIRLDRKSVVAWHRRYVRQVWQLSGEIFSLVVQLRPAGLCSFAANVSQSDWSRLRHRFFLFFVGLHHFNDGDICAMWTHHKSWTRYKKWQIEWTKRHDVVRTALTGHSTMGEGKTQFTKRLPTWTSLFN